MFTLAHSYMNPKKENELNLIVFLYKALIDNFCVVCVCVGVCFFVRFAVAVRNGRLLLLTATVTWNYFGHSQTAM